MFKWLKKKLSEFIIKVVKGNFTFISEDHVLRLIERNIERPIPDLEYLEINNNLAVTTVNLKKPEKWQLLVIRKKLSNDHFLKLVPYGEDLIEGLSYWVMKEHKKVIVLVYHSNSWWIVGIH